MGEGSLLIITTVNTKSQMSQYFSTGGDFAPPRRLLAMSEDILSCHNWRSVTGFLWVEVRDTVQGSTLHRIGPHDKELSRSKCPWC